MHVTLQKCGSSNCIQTLDAYVDFIGVHDFSQSSTSGLWVLK